MEEVDKRYVSGDGSYSAYTLFRQQLGLLTPRYDVKVLDLCS